MEIVQASAGVWLQIAEPFATGGNLALVLVPLGALRTGGVTKDGLGRPRG